MFKLIPSSLKSLILPKVGNLHKNYFYLQFTYMKMVPAFYIILKNYIKGKINKRTTVIESSSGNFAFGLALICNFLKIKLVIIGDKGIDKNLENKLKILNTKVILVGSSRSVKNIQILRLKELNKQLKKYKNVFWPRQYDNSDNINSYSKLKNYLSKSMDLKKIDYLVCSVGSGGSSAGFYKIIKNFNPKVKLIGVDSVNSIIFGNSVGKRMLRGPGSSVYPKNVKYSYFSYIYWVSDKEAYTSAIRLYKSCGFDSSPCVGAVHLVSQYLNKKYKNKNILSIFPETGERYSNTLFNLQWMKKNKLLSNKKFSPKKKKTINEDYKKFSYFNWNNRNFIR